MAQRLLLEGSDIDELLARVRAEHGPDAEIVSAQERLVGGVGGFFARRRYEVSVQLPDGPASSGDAISETIAQPSHPGSEHTMTAHGSASPLASTLYDALRDAAGGGSLEDLLSVADRQDGAVPSGGAARAGGFGASAAASEAAGFRPAPYVPASALQSPAQASAPAAAPAPAGAEPAPPAAQPAAQPVVQPRGAHRAEPSDAPGFEALLRDLMEQRELALQAGLGPQPADEPAPAPRGRHAALPTDAALAPAPAAPTLPPAAAAAPSTFAPAAPVRQYRPWENAVPAPAPASAAQPSPLAPEHRPWENAAPAPVAGHAVPPSATVHPTVPSAAPTPTPAPAPAPEASFAPRPAPAPRPNAAVLVDPVAEPETRRRTGHRRAAPAATAPPGLVKLGLSPDSPVRTTSADQRTVLLDLLSDVAAVAPTELRGTAVIVGPAGPARAVARALLAELGLPRQALLVANCDDEDLVVADVLVGAAERCGRHGAAVVVLATGSTRQEGRAAGRLAALLGAGPLTAVVDATREAEATRSWLAALADAGRSVDDLAAFDVTETSVPLRLLELGHPVSWLDAAPATLGAWAAPCLERLQA